MIAKRSIPSLGCLVVIGVVAVLIGMTIGYFGFRN